MIEAVFVFSVLTAGFEFMLLCALKPRTRLRLLGSHTATLAMHVFFITANLVIHFGSVTGSMTAITAGLCSVFVTNLARRAFGSVTEGRYYHVGWLKYNPDDLR